MDFDCEYGTNMKTKIKLQTFNFFIFLLGYQVNTTDACWTVVKFFFISPFIVFITMQDVNALEQMDCVGTMERKRNTIVWNILRMTFFSVSLSLF